MRTITNNYRDAKISNLGSGGEREPHLVTQTGVAPRAEIPKTHLFVLRPDGQRVDFNAYAYQGKPEAMNEIVFATMTEVMDTWPSALISKGQVFQKNRPPKTICRFQPTIL